MPGEHINAEPITELLREWRGGDANALERLGEFVYSDLHKRAEAYLRRERAGHSLQPTGLVHEAFIKLIGKNDIEWVDRNHFFAIAAQTMRRILVDNARSRHRAKRGGHAAEVPLDEATLVLPERTSIDLVGLDAALQELGLFDPRQARVVELKYFGGMTLDETAEILEISRETVKNDWRIARAWLRQRLQ